MIPQSPRTNGGSMVLFNERTVTMYRVKIIAVNSPCSQGTFVSPDEAARYADEYFSTVYSVTCQDELLEICEQMFDDGYDVVEYVEL